jgi:hypothetical protein
MTTQRRRILKQFTIDSISAVDRPCQEHAKAVIMKRDDSEEHSMEKIESFESFEKAVVAVAAASSIPTHEAMRKCALAYPDLLQKYQTEGTALAKAAGPRSVTKAEQDFELAVEAIQKRDGIPRHEAMKRARVEFEGEFEDYQNVPF